MTYEIKVNEQFGSLEVFFEGEAEEVKKACKGEKVKRTTTKAAKPDTHAFDAYMEEMRIYWKNDAGMLKHFKTTTAAVVELENGDLIPIDKPRIETRFCFGYGLYGVSTDEEYKDAENMRQHAETSREYFIKENLKGIEEIINELKDDSNEVYTALAYIGQDEGTKTKSYHITRLCKNPEYNPAWWANYKELAKMTTADRERLIKAYEEVKQAFIKRLNTYLKRYGLSKIDTWTYLVD